jgi:hypothetical protein
MCQRLIRIKRDMRTARYHEFSAFSEFAGKTVCLRRESGEERERDEVGAGVEVNRFHLLVNHTNLAEAAR